MLNIPRYLLPVLLLQRAWRLNGRRWIAAFGGRRALNPGYVSTSVPVPIATLMDAMADAMLIASPAGTNEPLAPDAAER